MRPSRSSRHWPPPSSSAPSTSAPSAGSPRPTKPTPPKSGLRRSPGTWPKITPAPAAAPASLPPAPSATAPPPSPPSPPTPSPSPAPTPISAAPPFPPAPSRRAAPPPSVRQPRRHAQRHRRFRRLRLGPPPGRRRLRPQHPFQHHAHHVCIRFRRPQYPQHRGRRHGRCPLRHRQLARLLRVHPQPHRLDTGEPNHLYRLLQPQHCVDQPIHLRQPSSERNPPRPRTRHRRRAFPDRRLRSDRLPPRPSPPPRRPGRVSPPPPRATGSRNRRAAPVRPPQLARDPSPQPAQPRPESQTHPRSV